MSPRLESPERGSGVGLVSHDYIVNTNVTYMPDAFKDMLDKNKAAAYGDRKNAADAIQRGDRVFLYHTGVGIIAVGRALDHVRIAACGNDPDGEHFVPIRFDLHADPVATPWKCVPAWEINQALGACYRFRRTVFSVESDMADKIEELLRKKHARAPGS